MSCNCFTGSTICGHYKFTPCFNKCVNSFIAVDYYLNIDMSDDGITWSQPGRPASASSSQGRSVNVVDLYQVILKCFGHTTIMLVWVDCMLLT